MPWCTCARGRLNDYQGAYVRYLKTLILVGGIVLVAACCVASAEAASTASLESKYSHLYGKSVGRWTGPALGAGWKKSELGQLMYIIHRESRGQPRARNPYSGCAGLLQLHPNWYRGVWWPYRFDPMDGPTNLKYGHKIWHRAGGWSPWAL